MGPSQLSSSLLSKFSSSDTFIGGVPLSQLSVFEELFGSSSITRLNFATDLFAMGFEL
jgi:hypothetical protein